MTPHFSIDRLLRSNPSTKPLDVAGILRWYGDPFAALAVHADPPRDLVSQVIA